MRFASLVAALCLAAGCSGYQPYLPDGGRARVNCTDGLQLGVPVTVLDRAGDPAPESVVEVEYLSYGENENLIADGRGLVIVKDKHGPGTVRVRANLNDLRSDIAEIQFTGTECSAAAIPRSLTLPVK